MVTAVITRASSGLGKEYINAIIAQYPSVDAFWLVARRKEVLKEIAEEHPDKTIAAISLDLSKERASACSNSCSRRTTRRSRCWSTTQDSASAPIFLLQSGLSKTGMVDLKLQGPHRYHALCLPFICWTTA